MQSLYTITNTVNNKKYVGCGVAWYRKEKHLYCLRTHRHTNKPLQEDFDKYGESAFVFETLFEGNFADERALMIELKTYDERFGYNSVDPGMKKVRRLHGLPVAPSPMKGKHRTKREDA